jgi:predicted nucleic acid-binding protein
MKHQTHPSNVASARLLREWVDERTFVWLITDEVLDEYKNVLATCGVRPHVIGRVINLLRKHGEIVRPGSSLNISPDHDDNHICHLGPAARETA